MYFSKLTHLKRSKDQLPAELLQKELSILLVPTAQILCPERFGKRVFQKFSISRRSKDQAPVEIF